MAKDRTDHQQTEGGTETASDPVQINQELDSKALANAIKLLKKLSQPGARDLVGKLTLLQQAGSSATLLGALGQKSKGEERAVAVVGGMRLLQQMPLQDEDEKTQRLDAVTRLGGLLLRVDEKLTEQRRTPYALGVENVVRGTYR